MKTQFQTPSKIRHEDKETYFKFGKANLLIFVMLRLVELLFQFFRQLYITCLNLKISSTKLPLNW